jgi:hypothetical protein
VSPASSIVNVIHPAPRQYRVLARKSSIIIVRHSNRTYTREFSRASYRILLTIPDLEHYIAELKRTREKGMREWLSGVSLPPPQWGGALGLARRGARRS